MLKDITMVTYPGGPMPLRYKPGSGFTAVLYWEGAWGRPKERSVRAGPWATLGEAIAWRNSVRG